MLLVFLSAYILMSKILTERLKHWIHMTLILAAACRVHHFIYVRHGTTGLLQHIMQYSIQITLHNSAHQLFVHWWRTHTHPGATKHITLFWRIDKINEWEKKDSLVFASTQKHTNASRRKQNELLKNHGNFGAKIIFTDEITFCLFCIFQPIPVTLLAEWLLARHSCHYFITILQCSHLYESHERTKYSLFSILSYITFEWGTDVHMICVLVQAARSRAQHWFGCWDGIHLKCRLNLQKKTNFFSLHNFILLLLLFYSFSYSR